MIAEKNSPLKVAADVKRGVITTQKHVAAEDTSSGTVFLPSGREGSGGAEDTAVTGKGNKKNKKKKKTKSDVGAGSGNTFERLLESASLDMFGEEDQQQQQVREGEDGDEEVGSTPSIPEPAGETERVDGDEESGLEKDVFVDRPMIDDDEDEPLGEGEGDGSDTAQQREPESLKAYDGAAVAAAATTVESTVPVSSAPRSLPIIDQNLSGFVAGLRAVEADFPAVPGAMGLDEWLAKVLAMPPAELDALSSQAFAEHHRLAEKGFFQDGQPAAPAAAQATGDRTSVE